MANHSCIKCKKQYEDDDVEAYYCASCLEEKQRIAKEIDAKMAARPKRESRSMLDEYNSAPKGPGGFMVVKL